MAKKTYLEREAVIKYLSDVKSVCIDNLEFEAADNLDEIIREISEDGIPAAHIISAKHGHWNVGYFHDRVCSCCTHPSNDLGNYPYKFCPHCGAKMDVGDENG